MLQTLSSRPYFADIAYSASILERLYQRVVLLNTLVPVWCQNHISIPELVLCLTVSSWLEITVIHIIWSVGTFVHISLHCDLLPVLIRSAQTDHFFMHLHYIKIQTLQKHASVCLFPVCSSILLFIDCLFIVCHSKCLLRVRKITTLSLQSSQFMFECQHRTKIFVMDLNDYFFLTLSVQMWYNKMKQ